MTPEQQILSPDCPEWIWWDLAKAHPIHAMQSDLYPLLALLESPGRWVALEKEQAEDWYDALTQNKIRDYPFSDRADRLLGVECATRVLPIFEAHHPKDTRPREAIQQATLVALGLTSPETAAAAGDAAKVAASKTRFYHSAMSAAVITYSPGRNASWAAAHATGAVSSKESFIWAWRRALEFLFAPSQLPSPWDAYVQINIALR